MSTPTSTVPNHHADYPGFSGLSGLVAALSMVTGRGPVARLAADLVSVADDDRVVDVGCGPGPAAREAARRGAHVTAVDPSEVMLSVARVLTRRRASIAWTAGAAESLPLPDASATVVWSLACVHHWTDIDEGLIEVRRVLRPGGRFLAIERGILAGAAGLASHGWTEAQANAFADACRDAGFTDVRTETHQADRTLVLAVLATNP